MAKAFHVVLLPWSAFGHMMPFFELALGLARCGVRVSFISTPKNIERLPKPPSHLASLISFVDFPLPSSVSLPAGAEATVDFSSMEDIQYLKIAYDLLQHPFKEFVADQSPDWIIADVISHWSARIARDHRVPHMVFSVFSATVCQFWGNTECLAGDGQRRLRPSSESLTSVPEWVDFPSSVCLPTFLATGAHAGFYGMNASGISDAQRLAVLIDASQAVAFRSCPEFEGEYLELLPKFYGKPVIPVGLLTPDPPNGSSKNLHQNPNHNEMFKWLDGQNPESVVFVGFGSECKLSKDQVREIAFGLELSGLPFLWALRKPDWAASADADDALPTGFAERTRDRGIVSVGWAPQMEILAHPSTGGSLFHSGWGSVIETLQFGHRLIVLPFIYDQPLNTRALVDKGLAVEVERNELDGSFTRDAVAKALRLAMASEEGRRLRQRAREAATTIKDKKVHHDYFAKFVEYLKLNTVV